MGNELSSAIVFPVAARSASAGRRLPRSVASYARKSPLGAAAFGIIALLALVAFFASWIAPYDPLEVHRADRLISPGAKYWLGTDQSGRDQFSRLVYGTRVSLYVGIAPVVISGVAGTFFGVISGYFGGWVDAAVQRFADAFMSIPALVIALTLVALLGPSVSNVVIAIAVVTVPTVNRVARAATLQVVNLPFVLAAQSLGASNTRIIARHVVPNVAGSVIVVGASLTGGAVLAEAGLSFLGVGIRPPTATWGNLIGGENRTLFEIAPWLVIFPGLALTLTVLALNIAGDAVRDLLDPRSSGHGH